MFTLKNTELSIVFQELEQAYGLLSENGQPYSQEKKCLPGQTGVNTTQVKCFIVTKKVNSVKAD